jgi:glyoxylase-like metal-dependent hydrolase (beta-lactamase superfamily II)
MYRTRVGDVEVISLVDIEFSFDAHRVWPEAGDALEAYRDRLQPDGKVHMDDLCFLLRADGRTVLVDTGMGPESNGLLIEELREASVSPADVDFVIFTHLHGDHVGWNIDRATGAPLFANARYLVPRGDWDHYDAASPASASFVRDVKPLAATGQLDLIEGEHVITPSLVTVATPGHTPGHTSVAVTSQGERGFILGDAILTTLDLEQPDWWSTFESDPQQAIRTRHALLERLEQDGSLVGAAHFERPGLGRIVRGPSGRVWQGVEL